ncbi:MAG: transcriptional regulator, tetR family [Modestobacter sp.]|nr:transcriptional regulator, tetR family [Modestobacter sp.]
MVRSDASENVSRLIRATRDRVAADGPGVGVRAIAAYAGLGTTTLYRHFPDKAALVDGVSVHRWSVLRDLVSRDLPAGAALGRVVLVTELLSRMVTADRAFIAAAGLRVGREPRAITPAKAAFDAALATVWARAVREGQVRRSADPRDLVELAGTVSDPSRRASRLGLLLAGVSAVPEDGERLLAAGLRRPDPVWL